MKTLNPDLTLLQKEIIVGTVLGGSSIVKPAKGHNCYLSMRDRDAHWLEYKATNLKILASHAPYTLPKQGGTYRWHSMCYPIFNEYREMFYRRGKRHVNPEVLDLLRDWGLAVWFVDCGKLIKDRAVLNTNVWGLKGSRAIANYFRSLGYDVNVRQDRGGQRVWLDELSTTKFLEIVMGPLPVFVKKMVSH